DTDEREDEQIEHALAPKAGRTRKAGRAPKRSATLPGATQTIEAGAATGRPERHEREASGRSHLGTRRNHGHVLRSRSARGSFGPVEHSPSPRRSHTRRARRAPVGAPDARSAEAAGGDLETGRAEPFAEHVPERHRRGEDTATGVQGRAAEGEREGGLG